jgi:predicted secreted protein
VSDVVVRCPNRYRKVSNTDISHEEQPYLRLIQDLNERVQVERPQNTPFRQQVSVTADIKLCTIAFEPDLYSDTCASGVKGVEERKRFPVVVM